MNVLIWWQFGQISINFFIFEFDGPILDGVVMQLELFGHDEHLFLAEETDAE